MRWGETYEEAAKSELKEETGIESEIQFIDSIKYQSEKLKYNGKIYFCKTNQSIRFNAEEIETWEWIDIKQLENELEIKKFIPDFLAIWEEVKDTILTII